MMQVRTYMYFIVHLHLCASGLAASLRPLTSFPVASSGEFFNVTHNVLLLSSSEEVARYNLCAIMLKEWEGLRAAVCHHQTLATTEQPAPPKSLSFRITATRSLPGAMFTVHCGKPLVIQIDMPRRISWGCRNGNMIGLM